MARDSSPKSPPDSGGDGDGESDAPPQRVTRHVQPVGPRVLVRILKSPDRSETGLFLPQGVKDDHASALMGEVLEVARTLPQADIADDDDDRDGSDDRMRQADFGKNVSGIPLGANVLFEKERGVSVPWDESLRLLEVRHVLALVDIISPDELQ